MRTALLAGVALTLAGCTVGPNYHRPALDIPSNYRNAGTPPDLTSIGNEKWWNLFQDQEMQNLIRAALDRNYDLRIAASRILEAQAQVGITRSNQFPQVNGEAAYTGQKIPLFGFAAAELQGLFSWNIDF